MKEGDWVCPACSNHNYKDKLYCNKCRVPKPAALAQSTSSTPPAVYIAGIGKKDKRLSDPRKLGLRNASATIARFVERTGLRPLEEMSVKELKEFLGNRGIAFDGILEKSELVALVRTAKEREAKKEALRQASGPSDLKVPPSVFSGSAAVHPDPPASSSEANARHRHVLPHANSFAVAVARLLLLQRAEERPLPSE